MEDVPVEGPWHAPALGFKADDDNTTHRYQEHKPLLPAGRAIVNMAMAENASGLKKAAKQFGDALEWYTAPGRESKIDAQLQAMHPQAVKKMAGIDVDRMVYELGELMIKVPGGPGKTSSMKPRYDNDQLAQMKELLYLAKDRAAQLIR